MRWWPLLLIGVGLLSLGEWWLDRTVPARIVDLTAARTGA